MADGFNDGRRERVADLLADFRDLQHYIAAVPTTPTHQDDYYTEGYAALRQCALDGQHILNVAADTRVPAARGGPAEQEKAELQQVMLDAFARRHEAQKIYRRQACVARWLGWRATVLQGRRPGSSQTANLNRLDQALRAELAQVTDEAVYNEMRSSDFGVGRWIEEDPSLRHVQRWVRSRR